jgi:hypothetical protein
MLPDYPKLKRFARREFLLWTQREVPKVAPLLGQISRTRQHEGKSARLVRLDSSEAVLDYPESSVSFQIERSEMRSFNMGRLQERLRQVARDMAEIQEKMMFNKISEAADEAGNVVDGKGAPLDADHFLEALEKIEMTFDPQTLEPTGLSIVIHPSMAETVMARAAEWEKDPVFLARHQALMERKREEWRARESDRKLVD